MDWASVAKLAAPFAPALGGLLGGFIPIPGGALAGQAIGSIIAKQFGVPATPEAVAGAIQGNPNEVVIAKLRAATEEAKIQGYITVETEKAWAATQTVAITEVNETMRQEFANRHWFYTGWRPAAGWIFDFFAVLLGMLLAWATVMAIGSNAVPLNTIKDAWPIYAAFLGILAAMVGVYIIGRSNEKVKNATTDVTPVKPKGK